MNIDVATIDGWLDMLDPAAQIFNPQDTNPAAIAGRNICDALSAAIMKFLEDNGYRPTEQGWVKT